MSATRKWIGASAIIFVAAVVGGTLGREAVRLLLGGLGRDDIRSQRVLSKVANDLNKTLPIQVDRDTELMATAGLEATLVYSYRLINHSAGDVDVAAFSIAMRPQLVNSACTTPQTRDVFLKKGVTMRYMYADRDRRHIATIDVKPSDCRF